MIGNKIRYKYRQSWDFKEVEDIGIVVDAWTDVSGSVKGAGILGFSETSGSTTSTRKYKVQPIGSIYFREIYHWDVKEILEFKANQVDEKILIHK